MDLDFTIFA